MAWAFLFFQQQDKICYAWARKIKCRMQDYCCHLFSKLQLRLHNIRIICILFKKSASFLHSFSAFFAYSSCIGK